MEWRSDVQVEKRACLSAEMKGATHPLYHSQEQLRRLRWTGIAVDTRDDWQEIKIARRVKSAPEN